jgi:hypothetical protein
MGLTVVSNSTPIIALAKINRIDMLRELFGTITIPEAVYNEVSDDGKNRAGSSEVSDSEWIIMKQVHNRTAVDFLLVSVDLGEAEAIALAKESDGFKGVGRRLDSVFHQSLVPSPRVQRVASLLEVGTGFHLDSVDRRI